MTHKAVVKVSFDEGLQNESTYFLKRLIEKIILDQLDVPLQVKGTLLLNNQDAIEEQ
ncbi:hypothetical protein SAMN06295926_1224 [Lysinibacillus sp. AC-3]|uniref:hypothetical protein n=1 Tax=unclassified Lysinibacillus TaxID=2636778 RepID=UPI0009C71C2E|nr:MULTISPECIES: hypothetical protein [unclassified Lysinibacillus]SKC08848.1 hypothetical protein SAMN06295926_1224 [Lysinibacillus sp. AC-3]